MATRKSSSVCSAGVIDIVCRTLQAKLLTNDLSSGSRRCIQFGYLLLSPCKFQCQAGKATAKNWKNSIRYQDQPLSRALESYIDPDGKRCCCFIGLSVASGLDIPPNSQPPGISLTVSSAGDVSSSDYQPETELTSQPEMSPSDNVRLPEFQPVAPLTSTGALSTPLPSVSPWILLTRKSSTGKRTILNCLVVQLASSFVSELTQLFEL